MREVGEEEVEEEKEEMVKEKEVPHRCQSTHPISPQRPQRQYSILLTHAPPVTHSIP